VSNGEHNDWLSWGLEVLKWSLAGIATLGSSSILYIGRRYRSYEAKLEECHEYVTYLKQRKTGGRVLQYRRDIKELKSQLRAALKRNEEMQELVRTNNFKIEKYESVCQNLTTLVDLRGKEHHEMRNSQQAIYNRLTILETQARIKKDWQQPAGE
jgi:predicted RNase H-like nuclease (RuvC/YqgF family)